MCEDTLRITSQISIKRVLFQKVLKEEARLPSQLFLWPRFFSIVKSLNRQQEQPHIYLCSCVYTKKYLWTDLKIKNKDILFHFPKHLPATALLDCSFPCRWAGRPRSLEPIQAGPELLSSQRFRQLAAHVCMTANITLWSQCESFPKEKSCRPLYSSWHSGCSHDPRMKKPINNFSFLVYTAPLSVGCFLLVVFKS